MGYWNRARRILDVRQKQAEETRRADLEVDSLRMAEELFKNGHYDLATIEAFRALEIAARGSANKVDRTLRRKKERLVSGPGCVPAGAVTAVPRASTDGSK